MMTGMRSTEGVRQACKSSPLPSGGSHVMRRDELPLFQKAGQPPTDLYGQVGVSSPAYFPVVGTSWNY